MLYNSYSQGSKNWKDNECYCGYILIEYGKCSMFEREE